MRLVLKYSFAFLVFLSFVAVSIGGYIMSSEKPSDLQGGQAIMVIGRLQTNDETICRLYDGTLTQTNWHQAGWALVSFSQVHVATPDGDARWVDTSMVLPVDLSVPLCPGR